MALELNASKHRIYEYVGRGCPSPPPTPSSSGPPPPPRSWVRPGPAPVWLRGEACPFPVNRACSASWGPTARPPCPPARLSGDRGPAWRPAELGPGSCRGGGRGRWGRPGTPGPPGDGSALCAPGFPARWGRSSWQRDGEECESFLLGARPATSPGTWSLQPRTLAGTCVIDQRAEVSHRRRGRRSVLGIGGGTGRRREVPLRPLRRGWPLPLVLSWSSRVPVSSHRGTCSPSLGSSLGASSHLAHPCKGPVSRF